MDEPPEKFGELARYGFRSWRVRELMADFLFEIGLEEVPARMISVAQAELGQRVVKMLEAANLSISKRGALVYL